MSGDYQQRPTIPKRDFTIHLISDSTGTTLQSFSRAITSQFTDVHAHERYWPMIRSEQQLQRVIENISQHQGPVLFTLVDRKLRQLLQQACRKLHLPCLAVLDPALKAMAAYTGLQPKGVPGLQHLMDDNYFKRIDAIDFAMGFDDGQEMEGLEEADVILVGVSRTSKTPTCVFLSRYGIKAGNIPYIPGQGIPANALTLKNPLMVGLTESPDRLIQLRASRLKSGEGARQLALFGNSYLDPEAVEAEVQESLRFFRRQNWPIIDVTKRSVEETAADVLALLQKRKDFTLP